MIISLLLVDGRRDETAFELMNNEGAFVRLLELILSLRGNTSFDGAGLQGMLMDLFYEMSRIQRIKIEDLGAFVTYSGLYFSTALLTGLLPGDSRSG